MSEEAFQLLTDDTVITQEVDGDTHQTVTPSPTKVPKVDVSEINAALIESYGLHANKGVLRTHVPSGRLRDCNLEKLFRKLINLPISQFGGEISGLQSQEVAQLPRLQLLQVYNSRNAAKAVSHKSWLTVENSGKTLTHDEVDSESGLGTVKTAKRIQIFTLTDGQGTKIKAMEWSTVGLLDRVKEIYPGTKVMIDLAFTTPLLIDDCAHSGGSGGKAKKKKGKKKQRKWLYLLREGSVKFIGGEVEAMTKKMIHLKQSKEKSQRIFLNNLRRDETPPPPFNESDLSKNMKETRYDDYIRQQKRGDHQSEKKQQHIHQDQRDEDERQSRSAKSRKREYSAADHDSRGSTATAAAAAAVPYGGHSRKQSGDHRKKKDMKDRNRGDSRKSRRSQASSEQSRRRDDRSHDRHAESHPSESRPSGDYRKREQQKKSGRDQRRSQDSRRKGQSDRERDSRKREDPKRRRDGRSDRGRRPVELNDLFDAPHFPVFEPRIEVKFEKIWTADQGRGRPMLGAEIHDRDCECSAVLTQDCLLNLVRRHGFEMDEYLQSDLHGLLVGPHQYFECDIELEHGSEAMPKIHHIHI